MIEVDKKKKSTGLVEEPISLPRAIVGKLQSLYADESSGYDVPSAVKNISDATLGKKIAPGLFLSQMDSVPTIHLLATPSASTFKDFEATQKALIEYLNQHQFIKGVSPSKSALRVMIILIRNLPGTTEVDSKQLAKLKKQACGLDLDNPKDPKWNRDIQIRIADTETLVRLSIQKNNTATQLCNKYLGSDIPEEQRGHKYSYRLEISLANPTKTDALVKTESIANQLRSVGLALIPTMAVGALSMGFISNNLIPYVSDNPLIQGLLGHGIQIICAFGVCLTTYNLLNARLQRNKHLGS